MKPTSTQLIVALGPVINYPLECDGMSNVISRVLFECNVPHRVISGSVAHPETFGAIPYHVWIELEDGQLVDLTLGMWLESDDLPFGIFNPQEHPGLVYVPKFEQTTEPSAFIANILTDGEYVKATTELRAQLAISIDSSLSTSAQDELKVKP